MHVDHDLEIGTELATQRAQNLEREVKVCVAAEKLRRTEGIYFERLESLAHDGFCHLYEVFGSALGPVPSVGVGENRVSMFASQKLPDGDAKGFSENIPTGHFDCAHNHAMDV